MVFVTFGAEYVGLFPVHVVVLSCSCCIWLNLNVLPSPLLHVRLPGISLSHSFFGSHVHVVEVLPVCDSQGVSYDLTSGVLCPCDALISALMWFCWCVSVAPLFFVSVP